MNSLISLPKAEYITGMITPISTRPAAMTTQADARWSRTCSAAAGRSRGRPCFAGGIICRVVGVVLHERLLEARGLDEQVPDARRR